MKKKTSIFKIIFAIVTVIYLVYEFKYDFMMIDYRNTGNLIYRPPFYDAFRVFELPYGIVVIIGFLMIISNQNDKDILS